MIICNYSEGNIPRGVLACFLPKSRDIQSKMPSPKVIWNAFWLVTVRILNSYDNTEKSEQQELVEDLVQIITVFSCKLQGKRANKAKKLIRELIQEETDGKSHKSNADTKQCTEN